MSTAGKPTAKAEARAQAQRERILVAAQKCFVVHGFHAASMANIADTAGMSAGLIYRYFKGKNDIILAIIERQLEEARADVAKLHATSDLVAGIAEVFQQWQANDPNITSAALFLELTAEATRDPEIAAATHASDKVFRADLAAWFERSSKDGGLGVPKQEVDTRVLMLQCLIEGLAMRAISQPDLSVAQVKTALERFLPSLLSAQV
ncbi:TetR/AcrR family transcriptional regulator [Lysobacter capsici]|jgi:AcrR family transcriptional regulator|uniref:Transcriptional regulator, TetR family n=1 Tax=Lysobacter capsici AZ78 TaxID=1444315 RepID=A0A120AGL9_9GAMM|nr:TetR/AcrR family transcriptional regulator [Lysobacter capsici]ALN84025.1 bacterial regulatory, tetR family protein [Lysobacter capsici]ATE70440.1 TetR/AcrR family transcriptional regulator [Lysobacter capsici]KWS04792.1 Transcriptional regulator, TetR family [Lysobacter capsici AZ78]UOF15689.1 TetR/AcrR family transcriptional regulator [Lysobacter capsici]WND81410.1 TetR/AcrR family transcriptional regulator [Lysobacter capsici]